jgi:L-malate glycosyltransferase
MRILYFTRAYAIHDARFLSTLAASPHEVWFLPFFQEGSDAWRLPEGVRLVRWPSPNAPSDGGLEAWLAAMPHFEEILSTVQPDVLHAGPMQPCGFLAALSGFRPFIMMSWGYDILLEAPASDRARWIARYTLRNADMLLCDCRTVREAACEIHPLREDQVVELPWGVDLKAFTPALPGEDPGPGFGWDDAFVILSTRNWEPIYGTEVLLESFRLARRSNGRLRLALLGTGSLASAVRAFASDPEVRGAVHLSGAVALEELPRYFQQADLYMSCSITDGTSVSLLEAFASGLPVLVSDLPANREWVVPGKNGWLGEVGNPGAFAKSLLEAAALDPARRAAIGRANRRMAEERADWLKNFPLVLEAYEKLISRQ